MILNDACSQDCRHDAKFCRMLKRQADMLLFPAQTHSGSGATETVPIDKQPAYVLGRQPDAVDVTLDEQSASRQHAALVHHEDGRLFLIDLGSVSSCSMISCR